MQRGSRWVWAGLLLAAASFLAAPLHLPLEAHEAFHEASGGRLSHHESEGSHPAFDHEVNALARVPGLSFPGLAFAPATPVVPAATTCTWAPRIAAGALVPPDPHDPPPRSPRTPPL